MASVTITSIYARPKDHNCVPTDILYQLLYERQPYESISHTGMPSYQDHKDFIERHPYKNWWIIYSDLGAGMVAVGSMYLTYNNEIGIAVFNKYRRKGYAENAIGILMRVTNEPFYLAHINPINEKSIKLFAKFGFLHIQNTYKLIPPPPDDKQPGEPNVVS